MFRKKEHDTPRELRAYKYAIFPEEIPEDLWSLARRMKERMVDNVRCLFYLVKEMLLRNR